MTEIPIHTAPDDSMEGVVDGLNGETLRGWARSKRPADPAVIIQVHHGERLLGAAEAAAYRADLASAGKGDGRCAFAITLAPSPAAGTRLRVTAMAGNVAHELAGSPYTVPEPRSPQLQAPARAVLVLPLPLAAAELQGSLDQCSPTRLRGWLRRLDGSHRVPSLSLCEGEHEWLRFEADQWRTDLAELHQDDGCCGFDLRLPDALCDDQVHLLDLRLADGGGSALQAPFEIRLRSSADSHPAASRQPAPLRRETAGDQLKLSVLVNFYNMPREAARTLTSLSRAYQRGADDLDYEVLCVDNGSNPPLNPAWVESFGPEFRLIRPSRQLSSPCSALNEAALQARGEYVAVMIDGAHLLTPGVFEEARQAWREHPDAVVALRHWFVGGDQRWLAMAGYTREQEDRLFERIRWPANGYELFRIGAPIGENPEPWFDGLSESNCLMLPTALYDRIGGFDEAFDQAGGGFANLDLWRRASHEASGPLVALIGEASFHQFHDGTTTNVLDAEKDLRVRAYANAYRTLRGEDYAGVHRSNLCFRGRMASEFASGVRQRTLLPMRLGITDRVRPGQLALHFDDGAQTYLKSTYAECGLHQEVRWLGLPVGVAPADLLSVQEIIFQLRPDAVIAVGAEGGLVAFVDTCLHAAGLPDARILHAGPSAATVARARVTVLHGAPSDPALLATAQHWVGSAESVLVLHAVGPAESFSVASLRFWGALVSYRSWLVCLGTLFGQPWLGYSTHEHLQTVRDFIRSDPAFVIDRSWNRQLISTCPFGYLRKVGGSCTAANYDASLDILTPARPVPPENPQ
jgi:cephalosporin hydroxylase